MNTRLLSLAALAALVSTPALQAHLGFSGDRNFDTLSTGVTETATSRTVSGSFGWADGTNANQGDSHRLTYFRFSLSTTTSVSISVARNDLPAQTGAAGVLLPAFSLYNTSASSDGAVPASPNATHDSSAPGAAYLTGLYGTSAVAESYDDSNLNNEWDAGESFTDSNGDGEYTSAGIGASGKEGAFNALGDWRIYNDIGTYGQFDYVGHVADGTFDPLTGINGDGLADGLVSLTFTDLLAGEYFIVVGGADFDAQLTEDNIYGGAGTSFPTYGIAVSVTAIPEPASFAALAGVGALGIVAARRRRAA